MELALSSVGIDYHIDGALSVCVYFVRPLVSAPINKAYILRFSTQPHVIAIISCREAEGGGGAENTRAQPRRNISRLRERLRKIPAWKLSLRPASGPHRITSSLTTILATVCLAHHWWRKKLASSPKGSRRIRAFEVSRWLVSKQKFANFNLKCS